MRKSALAVGLKKAAAVDHRATPAPTGKSGEARTLSQTVLIGGHFPPEVRRVLMLVQAEPDNAGKNLKQLLGEAINDLCAKYRKPQPYTGEP